MSSMYETRPGKQTTEFLATVATIVGVIATALVGVLPAEYAAILATVATVAYAISRGVAKHGIASTAVYDDRFREPDEDDGDGARLAP